MKKYSTYYNDVENRLFKNLASTFIVHLHNGKFKRAMLEGERIVYEKIQD